MEQLKAFLEKAGTDNDLSAKLEALGEDTKHSEKLIAIAAEHGFTVTQEEIEEAKSAKPKGQLSEEELETVAGGTGGEEQSEGIDGWTVNRYCPEWCKNLTEDRYACQHPLFYCDHFRYVFERDEGFRVNYYWYSCVKGAFPRFLKKIDRRGNDYSGA